MHNQNNKIITRFAPSPTGVLHIGGARTALFNYLFSKQNNGEFILRIEDTDAERSKKEYEVDIINGLEWLEIKYDKIYRQSERKEIYKKYIRKLLNENKAYISEEPEGENKKVIRLRNPGKKIIFDDLIRGKIEFDTLELKDFVIAKNEESPLYHLAVVIDDFEMNITHIIRGEDHISNTPRQIMIQEAIGAPRPIYAHIPLILGADKSKLSKRHGAVSVSEYKKLGYLPEAVINLITFIGWNPGTEKEIYDINDLIKDFSLDKVHKSGAVFNIDRLIWMNKEYIRKTEIKTLSEKLIPFLPDKLKKKIESNSKLWAKVVDLEKERIETLAQIGENIDYFFEQPEYEKEKLLWKDEKNLNNAKNHLEKITEALKNIDEDNFMSQNIKEGIWKYAEEEGKGNVLWPFRFALTGLEKSPDPFTVSGILGKKETLNRLEVAINKI